MRFVALKKVVVGVVESTTMMSRECGGQVMLETKKNTSQFRLSDYVTLKRRKRLLIESDTDDDADEAADDNDGGESWNKKHRKDEYASFVDADIDTKNNNTWREIIDLTSDASDSDVVMDPSTTSASTTSSQVMKSTSNTEKLDAIFRHIMNGSSNDEQIELMREHNRYLRLKELKANNPYVYSFTECCQCQVLSDHDQFFKVRPRELQCIKPFRTAVATFASSLYLELNELEPDGEQSGDDLIPFNELLEVFIRKIFTVADELAHDIGESSGLGYLNEDNN